MEAMVWDKSSYQNKLEEKVVGNACGWQERRLVKICQVIGMEKHG